MNGQNKISNMQIKALMVTIIIGVGILSLPSDIAIVMGNDGWIGILLGGLITIPFIIMIDRLFKLYPNRDFFQLGKEIIHPIGFKFLLLIFFAYSILLLSVSIRIFADTIEVYLLETTPTEVIIITMLLATSYIARCQIETIARIAVMIYPIIFGFVLFLLII
ncbi:MAG: GerAB/ArcD/ProY family transporter, partial [Tissierellia bacterium]|nr:GerAB/ArcD/ProY family transporter [Tissierellia bacterium]